MGMRHNLMQAKEIFCKHKMCGRRVVWIGFWSCAPPHTSHSYASRKRFQARERHIHWMALTNSTMQLLMWQLLSQGHIFCSLAHLYQVTPCKGNYWLLSQTFPEVIGGVTSTQLVTSTMSFHPQKHDGKSHRINYPPDSQVTLVTVQEYGSFEYDKDRGCNNHQLDIVRLLLLFRW